MPTALVTGCNRGIGLTLCEFLKKRGYKVYATCRKSSPALDALNVHVLHDVDVSLPEGIQNMMKGIGNDPIDLLIHNAGILLVETIDNLDFDSITQQFQVNAVAPLRVTAALRQAKLLPPGSKIVLITSRMGSIGDNGSGSYYGYRMSKAAMNMSGVSLAIDLKKEGIAVLVAHPASVGTDMTLQFGHEGCITTEESARGILKLIDELTLANSGTFFHINGQILPW